MPERIWRYYRRLADFVGRNSDGTKKQFSVSWFYEQMSEHGIYESLNNLSLAFLGDEDAKASIHVATDDEIKQMQSTVRAICGDAPYTAQIEAISNAVLNDITIIQGPPGTGKTETIKNILLSIRNVVPQAKIAVISANSEAISNAEDAIKTEASLMESYARLGNQNLRKEFKIKLYRTKPDLYALLGECNKENEWKYPAIFLEHYPIVLSTIHSLRKCVDIAEYDYVIVDECSQVPSYIGMLAIASAKHLVLLGDDEQLPPVQPERMNDENLVVQQIRDEKPWYLDQNENSFMKACKASFDDKCKSILLNEHFRCHPAIIEFSNRYIYGEKLITRTTDDGKLPIRICWYEGDYWEKIESTGRGKAKNYNKKQIEVFIADELPDIMNVLNNDDDFGVCVVSPYRYQLELLKERLNDVLRNEDVQVDNQLQEEQDGINDVAQLTIHKAQGRGFDRVYIMPVEDTGRNPWSQKREIINVAVSRAKKELCVITSSIWMSEKLQNELTGVYIENVITGDNCLIHDLLQYVEDEQKTRDIGNNYGFVKSSLVSIFDKVPYYRQKYRCPDEKKVPGKKNKTSAPEHCLKNVLVENLEKDYNYYQEVPLAAIEGFETDDEELSKYIKSGAKFDFVVTKDDKVRAIIEVDGSYHRSDPETIHNDELKNRAVRLLGDEFADERFIRLVTDGTGFREIEELKRIIQNKVNEVQINYMETKMQRLIGKIKKNSSKKGRFYHFVVEKTINENGLVKRIDVNGLSEIIKQKHPDWNFNRLFSSGLNKITLRAQSNCAQTIALENLSRENKTLLFSLDLENDVVLNRPGTGFITRENFSGVPVVSNIDEAYSINRDNVESVIDYISGIFESSRESLQYLIDQIQGDENKVELFVGLDPEYQERNENLNFQIDHVSDFYSEVNKLLYYMNKYGYAYSYLYYKMYRYFIERRIPINVLSIGCGSKIDLVGLKLAMANGEINGNVYYYGVDAVDWSESEYCFYADEGLFEKAYIQDYLYSVNELDMNVIMFAYSMEELSQDCYKDDTGKLPWDYVCDLLPEKLCNDEVYIITPMKQGNHDFLHNQFEQLVESMGEYFDVVENEDVVASDTNPDIKDDEMGAELYDSFGRDSIIFMNQFKSLDSNLKCLPITKKWIENYRVTKFRRRH